MLGPAYFSYDPSVNGDLHEILAGVCGLCGLWTSRRSKTRLDFLDPSRIVQANGLAQMETKVQIEQNGISLSVSIQAEPVWTIHTSAQRAARYDSFLQEMSLYETSNYNRYRN